MHYAFCGAHFVCARTASGLIGVTLQPRSPKPNANNTLEGNSYIGMHIASVLVAKGGTAANNVGNFIKDDNVTVSYDAGAKAQRVSTSGNGSPEGVLMAAVGSIYIRLDGGAGSTLYVKETRTGNTGWVAK